MDGMHPPPAALELGVLCRRVAHELDLLAGLMSALEASLCNAEDAWGVDDARVKDLQHVDSVLQHLVALSEFLVRAAARDGAQIPIEVGDILDRVVLEDLKERLAGTGAGPACEGVGRLEWF